jgi:acyl-CoA synthetase (AMP-forming)/AMP-acid ligase II
MNIASLCEWAALNFGDKTAFADASRKLSFKQFNEEADRLASGLASLGVGFGNRVAIVLENCVEYPLAMFAITKIGAVIVPLLSKSSKAEMVQWFATAEIDAVITSASAAVEVLAAAAECPFPIKLITVGASDLAAASYERLVSSSPYPSIAEKISADDLFAIRFTGGTTGVPKGVMMSHRNYVTIYNNQLLNLPINGNDVALHIHPLSHAAGQMMYGYFACGATQFIHRAFGFSAAEFFDAVQQHKISSVFIIPTVLNSLLTYDGLKKADTSSLRSIVYGGAPIAPERLKQGLAAFGKVFVQLYGSSESAQVCTTLRLEDHIYDGDVPPPRFTSVGRPALNIELRVTDEHGKTLPTGEIGEIAIRGDHTMVGYWKNQELTAKRVRDSWVFTGDMGYLDQAGYLYLVDRQDDMIITGGFNVWPSEIEAVIYEHPAVKEVVVFGVQSDRWGEEVTAVVVPRDNTAVTSEDIIAFAQSKLTKYKVPKVVTVRSEPIPKSAVGKALRRATREQFLKG